MKIEYIDIKENKDSTTYRVRVPYYEDGKRKYISKSFCSDDYGSKKVALEQAKLFRDRTKVDANNKAIVNNSFSIKEIFDEMKLLSPTTDETKRKDTINFNKYIASRIPLNRKFKDITINDIQDSLNVLQNDKSDDVIEKVLSVWRKMYDYAIKNEIIQKDLTRQVVKPKSLKPHKKRDMACSKKELEEVIDMINNSNQQDKKLLIDALNIMYYLGIRPAECFALEKDCIDTKNRMVSIHQSISHKGRKPYISKTKTGLSIRSLSYPKKLDKVFKNFDGFKKPNGELWDSDYASNKIYRLTKGNFRMYKLRHLFATDYVEKGIDMRTLQEMMGHNDSAMTLSYARSNEEKIKKAMSEKR